LVTGVARAALVMDTLDMTFDPTPTRRAFADLPETDIRSVLKTCWPPSGRPVG